MLDSKNVKPEQDLSVDAVATLKKGEGRTIKAGGAWIFDNELDKVEGTFEDGEIIAVQDFDGFFMGYGFINRNSKIRIRMLSRRQDQKITPAFIRARVKAAWDYRKTVLQEKDLNACRIIFGEADFLPGLVIDKYADVLVVESLALGIDKLKMLILDYLIEEMEKDGYLIQGAYERSDAKVRIKEGMAQAKGVLYSRESAGFSTDVEIVENGVRYLVDVVNGQKTGFFLDQKYNRLAMQRIVGRALSLDENLGGKGTLKVLDCFTHMGTFALNAGIAGASDVTGLDISEYAVQQATDNAKRNGLQESVHFRCANVLDELPKLAEAGEKFDVVILDPPAFTKSREATKNAIKGYREINMKGMKLVRDGGYFATCSCSHFMTQDLFTKTVAQAAQSAHKRLRQIEFRTQAPDHPILWAADESYYLKFLIFQVVEEK